MTIHLPTSELIESLLLRRVSLLLWRIALLGETLLRRVSLLLWGESLLLLRRISWESTRRSLHRGISVLRLLGRHHSALHRITALSTSRSAVSLLRCGAVNHCRLCRSSIAAHRRHAGRRASRLNPSTKCITTNSLPLTADFSKIHPDQQRNSVSGYRCLDDQIQHCYSALAYRWY